MKTLAKIQVTAVFLKHDMQRKFLTTLIEIVWRLHAGAHPDGHRHGRQKQQKHLSPSFGTKAFIYLSRSSKTLK